MALLVVLGAAVLGLSALGLRGHFRTAARARAAHESGLHFAAADAFDVPRRCAAFALCSAGHSAQASNITYGRLRGLPVRAFDFRYEAGHGTRRATRYYFVVLVEEAASPSVLMWNRRDSANAPAPARVPGGACADWFFRGSQTQAQRLAGPCSPLAGLGVSLEARAEGLILCFPVRRRKVAGEGWQEATAGLMEAIWPASAQTGASGKGGEKGEPMAVANRPPS